MIEIRQGQWDGEGRTTYHWIRLPDGCKIKRESKKSVWIERPEGSDFQKGKHNVRVDGVILKPAENLPESRIHVGDDKGSPRLDFDGYVAGHSRLRTCPVCKQEMGYGHTARHPETRKWHHTSCLLRELTGKKPTLADEHRYERDNRKW